MTPEISVVMPVYNGEKYLREAIESILNQTFKNFEFIIINDGSTDSTEETIKTFSDPRIIYLHNRANLGLSKSFNIGIKAARGHYIARMDADDISGPDRFKKQLEFLKSHPEIDIVGTAVKIIDEFGRGSKVISKPSTHTELKWQSLLSTPLFHPTIMAMAQVLKNNPFDETLFNSEDYELWSRLLFNKSVQLANLTEPLLLYRITDQAFTRQLNPTKRAASAENSIKNIEQYVALTLEEKSLIIKSKKESHLSIGEFFSLTKLYRRVANAFATKEKFNPPLSYHTISLLKQVLK